MGLASTSAELLCPCLVASLTLPSLMEAAPDF